MLNTTCVQGTHIVHMQYKKVHALLNHMRRKANKLRKETLPFKKEVTMLFLWLHPHSLSTVSGALPRG